MRAAPIIATAATLAACVDGGQSVALPEGIDLGFVVLVEDGLAVDTTRIDTNLQTTTQNDQALYVLAFDRMQLLEQRRDLDLEDDPQLVPSDSMCPDGSASPDGITTRLPIRDARVWMLDRSSDEFVEVPSPGWTEQLALELTRNADTCIKTSSRFVPFGDTGPLLEGPIVLDGSTYSPADDDRYGGATALRRLQFLDDDRLLAISNDFIFLFERGRPFLGDPAHHRHRVWSPDDQRRFYSLAVVDPRTAVAVATNVQGGNPPYGSTIEVFDIGPGGIEDVERIELDARVRRIVAANGVVYAFSNDGSVATATRASGPYTIHPTEWGWERATVGTLDDLPVVAATTNAEVFDLRLSGTRLDLRPNEVPWTLGTTRFIPESLSSMDDVLWLGTAEGQIYRRDGRTWSEVLFELPSGIAGCSEVGECGERVNSTQIQSVATDGSGRPFVVLSGCTVLYGLPHQDHCRTDSISADGPRSAPRSDFEELGPSAQRNGEVVVGGRNGHLWIVESTRLESSTTAD